MTKLCECGCGQPAKSRFRRGHYLRPSLAERFAAKYTVADGGCWLWAGPMSQDGYGHIGANGKTVVGAHRVAYELYVGPIPEGCEIHHVCEVKNCVNPEHLIVVTRTEHAKFRIKPSCIHGHPRRPLPGGRWHCPTCLAASHQRWNERRRGRRQEVAA